jgi:hypothetical protein
MSGIGPEAEADDQALLGFDGVDAPSDGIEVCHAGDVA